MNPNQFFILYTLQSQSILYSYYNLISINSLFFILSIQKFIVILIVSGVVNSNYNGLLNGQLFFILCEFLILITLQSLFDSLYKLPTLCQSADWSKPLDLAWQVWESMGVDHH